MHLRELLAIGLICVLAGLAAAKDRTWTSSDGRTMQGEFVRELDGDVTFLVKGKLVTIALDKLSERDRQIVRDLAAGKSVPDEPVTTSTPAATAPVSSTPNGSKRAADDPFAPVPDRPDDPAEPSASPSKKKQKGTESRVWTDIFGRKATGKFIRIFGSNVVVSRAGGPLTIDFFQLSDADQTYVRELLTSRGEEDLIPVKPPPERQDPGGETGRPGIGISGNAGSSEEGPAEGAGPIGPGGPGISGPGMGPSGPGFGPRGPRGPRGVGRSGMGPSGMGPGISGPPPGLGGSGIGPGSNIGPGSIAIGPGSGVGNSSPLGPRGPAGFGPSGFGPSGIGPGSTATGTISPTPQPYNPTPTPNYGSSAGSFAQDQAERDRRNAEQMQSRIDQAAQSTANMFQRVPVCSNCRKQVTEAESKRSTCPHCGARWIFNQYNSSATSRSTSSSPLASLSGSANQRAVRTTLIVGGAIVVVIVLCGGAIAVALAIASASRPAQRYRI